MIPIVPVRMQPGVVTRYQQVEIHEVVLPFIPVRAAINSEPGLVLVLEVLKRRLSKLVCSAI